LGAPTIFSLSSDDELRGFLNKYDVNVFVVFQNKISEEAVFVNILQKIFKAF